MSEQAVADILVGKSPLLVLTSEDGFHDVTLTFGSRVDAEAMFDALERLLENAPMTRKSEHRKAKPHGGKSRLLREFYAVVKALPATPETDALLKRAEEYDPNIAQGPWICICHAHNEADCVCGAWSVPIPRDAQGMALKWRRREGGSGA